MEGFHEKEKWNHAIQYLKAWLFFIFLLYHFIIMSKQTLRDELIEKFSHDADTQGKLERVVVISIDESSAKYILEWALSNFLQPQRDLVSHTLKKYHIFNQMLIGVNLLL